MLQILMGALSLGLLWSIITIGVYLTYRILAIADLTVEGSIVMGAAIAAFSITRGFYPFLAILLAFLGGLGAGLITGLLHTKLKIPSLLAGILTMIALYSINLRLMGRANISLLRVDTAYTEFENMGMNNMSAIIVLGLIFVGGLTAVLDWVFGREIGCA